MTSCTRTSLKWLEFWLVVVRILAIRSKNIAHHHWAVLTSTRSFLSLHFPRLASQKNSKLGSSFKLFWGPPIEPTFLAPLLLLLVMILSLDGLTFRFFLGGREGSLSLILHLWLMLVLAIVAFLSDWSFGLVSNLWFLKKLRGSETCCDLLQEYSFGAKKKPFLHSQ